MAEKGFARIGRFAQGLLEFRRRLTYEHRKLWSRALASRLAMAESRFPLAVRDTVGDHFRATLAATFDRHSTHRCVRTETHTGRCLHQTYLRGPHLFPNLSFGLILSPLLYLRLLYSPRRVTLALHNQISQVNFSSRFPRFAPISISLFLSSYVSLLRKLK
ncbi:hypothetical protein VNO78_17047 [Psophocarpus tetragonolobus]|uniref:Uncharacterized protein n=1 Tax=Psophocarpus tetragonolobus TaxID=3891 RepID=A0AAN9XL10_PSOTE